MYTSYLTAWMMVSLRLIIQGKNTVGEEDDFRFVRKAWKWDYIPYIDSSEVCTKRPRKTNADITNINSQG